jgi:hypothetical protein
MRVKPLRCPKCNRFPEYYREFIEYCAEFNVDENGWPENEGNHSEGDYFKLEAFCRCGHAWRIRGASQITDVQALAGVEET